MNKRIQLLALKCGAWHQVYGNRSFMIDEHFDLEKFAEEVVKEYLAGFEIEVADLKERLNSYERKD
jgi:hypothetical protein